VFFSQLTDVVEICGEPFMFGLNVLSFKITPQKTVEKEIKMRFAKAKEYGIRPRYMGYTYDV